MKNTNTITVSNYLNQFFAEKEIDNVNYSIIDRNGSTHIFDNITLIDRIKNTGESEQRQIANVLKRIDFKDGSIQHFLNYLADSLIQNYTNS